MKICIHGRYINQDTLKLIKSLIDDPAGHGFEFSFTHSFYSILKNHGEGFSRFNSLDSKEDMKDIDIMISIGGDGTLLETISLTGSMQNPILGINTGRLGFLTSTTDKNIDKIMSDIFNNNYIIDERAMIRLDIPSNPFGETNYALNEIAILKSDTSAMITVHAYIDEHFLNSYWADGIVISTPTGSTGYSLSCGGPVVLPRSNNFIIAPVSVHNLSVRPIVVSDKSNLRFEIESRSGQFLVSLDSRSHTFFDKMSISVSREAFQAKLIKFRDYDYFETLRQKLNWGLDVRN